MSLNDFHPIIARWFAERLGEPTEPQRAGWTAIRDGRDTLIAAPTGSGKTLAAFLIELDQLLRQSLEGSLPEEVRVVYVSPLKALSADIHRNLAEPRREIRRLAEEMGYGAPRITAAVRSGDTPAAERSAMLKAPPHILVTTPESLYLLLTAQRSREMLRNVRTVIVDEIHAVVESRRGAHLALSLERLEHAAGRKLQRIGLSATLEPIETVADWLVGRRSLHPSSVPSDPPAIINAGHRRALDLALELPRSPLEAVLPGEVWEEIYDRLAELIRAHRTTLVFVNTRRLAERVARHLAERLGEDAVTAHHGSLAKEVRLDAEERLKSGGLQALVATASLELGIDIGHVDLVCQLGSPRRISTFLQRVGRSGHTVRGTPKGRLFPLSRDELVECVALLRTVRRGALDRIEIRAKPLDVLAQQLVAETASEDWDADDLFELFRRAYPYGELTRAEFDEVVAMVSQGFTTRRGRRGALVHHDPINGRLRGRRGARLLAITSGGAIPDNADYRVVLEPEGTFLGTVNEDFAVESMAGDIFQLGNLSWRIQRVQQGTVRVEDARGQPPSIPFWFGEAPARSPELSAAVSELRSEAESRLADRDRARAWLAMEAGSGDAAEPAALQLTEYLAEAERMLGTLPTQQTVVAERFFDESGGMQLVIHAPFGSRVNRAWGLALRKRFCRQFNFELQAAATEDAILLSLGPQHSFPLDNVFRFLQPETVADILVQALLDAPMFGTHWRWNSTIALAIARRRGGRRVPPQIQRMEADDLLAAAFPDAAACLENIPGDREIPDHPLVRQTVDDCLREVMDVDRLVTVLEGLRSGAIRCVARDLPEPSPLAAEILNARPYSFLDDAPLEERRAQAVYTRRAFEPSSAADLGALDEAAIARVRDEAWPDVRDADELHDVLLTSGFLTEAEGMTGRDRVSWSPLFVRLLEARRASAVKPNPNAQVLWVAAERVAELGDTKEMLRGRLGIVGPATASSLALPLGVAGSDVEAALVALEAEGVVLRGRFTPAAPGDTVDLEWADRRLLARIHRYTLNRLRAEIEPVSAADFMRFLFAWQHVDPEHRVAGLEGLAKAIGQLDRFEVPAAAWESDILAARCEEYDPALLDALCLSGRVAWGRLSGSQPGGRSAGPIRTTPVALFLREHAADWVADAPSDDGAALGEYARQVRAVLERRGASFFHELVAASGLLTTQVERALAELAGAGIVTADSFAGLRALITPSSKRKPPAGGLRRQGTVPFGIESAGRWGMLRNGRMSGGTNGQSRDAATLTSWANALLLRYGVVFRAILQQESGAPPWRDLLLTYRRMEARGEIRGGRFLAGLAGEQFALPEAVAQLRAVRRSHRSGRLIAVSAADPLNLTGVITPGDRVPGLASNRVLYQDGVPVMAIVAGEVRRLVPLDDTRGSELERAVVRKPVSAALRARLGMKGMPASVMQRRPGRRRRTATKAQGTGA
ncbi:MAG TPA: DEAD/DEAH box helicase [Gemmatimonadales bacterium]|nr:DEAD/DEAH box helicase [Gemmatimonadales bacterium]